MCHITAVYIKANKSALMKFPKLIHLTILTLH